MEDKSEIQSFNMAKVTDSVNGRLVVFECSKIKQNELLQMTLIKIINLVGNWPQGPTLFKRKNYDNLYEFVRYNSKKLPVAEFIKKAIADLMKFSAPEILYQTIHNPQILPTELFVSNQGNRISFWLTESNFQQVFNILTKLSLTELLRDFQWIQQNEQLYSNEIEYGSENFINLIEKFSLQSMMKVINFKDYKQAERYDVVQSLNSVFSLVNYNYRYFYPPKDATRFLKKTSGVVLVAKEKFNEQKSNKWAESVLLQSILELRPTLFLALILADPQGPLYQKKYVFSQKFYSSIEGIYFLGNIVNYFNNDNLRNDLKYFTFISRIFPDYLSISQVQSRIQKLKQQGWIRKEDDFDFQNSDSEIEEDSEQDEKQGQNKEENGIITLYKDSRSNLMKQCRKQLSQTIKRIAQNQRQRNHLDQNYKDKQFQQWNEVRLAAQILELNESCMNASVQICISCGFSYSTVSYEEKQLSEFLAMFNHGNDRFCYTCSNLSFKDKMIAQKQRFKASFKAIQVNKKEIQNEENIMKKQESKQSTNEESKSEKPKINTENQKSTSKNLQKQATKNINEIQQNIIARKAEKKLNEDEIQQDKKEILNKSQKIENLVSDNNKSNKNKKDSPFHKENLNEFEEVHRDVLIAERFIFSWGMMNLFLKNQTRQQISPQFFHDSLQLSQLGGPLATQERISEDLLVIYHFYFESMINYDMKKSRNNWKFLSRIPSIQDNLKVLHQRKYMKVENNVFQSVFSKAIKLDTNQARLFSIQNEQQQFTNNLYAFLQIKLEEYKAQISEHYRTYKNVMNQQYKVTEIELKEMIVKFQTDLKNSIIKTTHEFFLITRWLMLFISEYIEFKTIQLKKNKTLPEDENDIVYFINQIEFLLNLIATLVNVFNQPGQIKIVQLLENEILNLVFLFIQNQKLIQQYNKLSLEMDLQVVALLITDMIDHFVVKKGYQATEDAKKLSSKHYARFKSILQSKLKILTVKRILDFHQEIKTLQMKIASQSLISVAQKDILTIKDLYVSGELNPALGYFSSLLYLQRYFQKHQSSFHNNEQIKAHIGLLGFIMERCLKNDRLVLRSKSEPQYRIRFGVMYKIILQTVQKPQQAAQLVSVFRSGNKILIDLVNQFIAIAYELATQPIECSILAERIKLYIERIRHNHLRTTAKSTNHYNEILEILQFLFKHRSRFFNIEDKIAFEIQFHMIIQIVILNALPLYNIELGYKSELKEIMKELREFDTKDNYNEVEDYYLKVVAYRHDKAREKRKKEVGGKKEK